MLEEFYQNKKTILKKTQDFFSNSSSLIPKIGVELEFFLLERNLQALENQSLLTDLIVELKKKLTKIFPLIYEVEKERGASQIEIKTSFVADLIGLGCELENAKNFIKNFAEEKNLIASFASQPFADDCGNALQFNISLHDKSDKNLFESDENLLKKVASELLRKTDAMMIFLAPKAEDYSRFSCQINRDLFKKGKFSAPINLSFGADNRTCAIRIPAKNSINPHYGKRIEYRIAAAAADFFLITAAILLVINSALNKSENDSVFEMEQIFGNAFDEQYQLKNFCKSLGEAEEKFFCEENFVRNSLKIFLS